MKEKFMRGRQGKGDERGVVFLIVLICLMLLFTLAVLMILNAGTESYLNANYRASTRAFYAGLAGLEEARGRMSSRNPNTFSSTNPNFLPPTGTTMQVGSVSYVLNPGSGAAVNPTDLSWNNPYGDFEYQQEFGVPVTSAPNVLYANSVYSSGAPPAGLDGPLFKWVRITPVTEKSLNIDINNDAFLDPNTPLYFDGTQLNLISNGHQAFEITALAVLPDKSKKMLQYVVAPSVLNLSFPGALTLVGSPGNNVSFTGPGTPGFYVKGIDQYSAGSCAPSAPAIPAIAYTNGSDSSQITTSPPANYQGSIASPSLSAATLAANLQTPAGMEANLVQPIWENADTILAPSPPLPPGSFATYTQSNLPTGTMSATHPMTIVVNGNLDLTNWHGGTGYGLLLVTGTLIYDPDAYWDGIVLVIGQGKFESTRSGVGQFIGEMLIAKTRDSLGNILSSYGAASFSQTGASPSGYGIYYSSCWIKASQPPLAYKLLSFHEIPL